MKTALLFMWILFEVYILSKLETYIFDTYYIPYTIILFLSLLKIYDMAVYINKHID